MATQNSINLGLNGSTGTGKFVGDTSPTIATATINTATINTPAISGGTLDNNVIGGVTPAAGTFTQANVDNVQINGNTISTTDTNGDMNLTPDGSGEINLGGAGINFTGVVASANPETLDAYVNTSFTPVIADAAAGGNIGSAGTIEGYYTRIGNMLFYQIIILNIDTSGMTAGNVFFIRNLPNTANSSVSFYPASVRVHDVTFTEQIIANVVGNTQYLQLADLKTGTTPNDIIVSNIATGSADIWITGSYRI